MHRQLPRLSRGPRRAMRVYRISLGLTQRELGERLGVRQVLISDIELGRFNPDATLRIRIAEVFDCSPAELFPEPTQKAEYHRDHD